MPLTRPWPDIEVKRTRVKKLLVTTGETARHDRLQCKKVMKVADSTVRNSWISRIVEHPKFTDN